MDPPELLRRKGTQDFGMFWAPDFQRSSASNSGIQLDLITAIMGNIHR